MMFTLALIIGGVIGAMFCFGMAWNSNDQKDKRRKYLIWGFLFLIILIIGGIIAISSSSAGEDKCMNCGRQPIYSSGYCETCYEGFKKYTSSTNTPSSSSSSSTSKCQYKNSSGQRTCSNKATRGQLCDYHFNMLNDIYNDIVG